MAFTITGTVVGAGFANLWFGDVSGVWAEVAGIVLGGLGGWFGQGAGMSILNHMVYTKKLIHERDRAIALLNNTVSLHHHEDEVARLNEGITTLETELATIKDATPRATLSIDRFLDGWSVVVENTGPITAQFEARMQLVSTKGVPHAFSSVTQYMVMTPRDLVPEESSYFVVGEHDYAEDAEEGDSPVTMIMFVPPTPGDPARIQLFRARIVPGEPSPVATVKVTVTSKPDIEGGHLIEHFEFSADGLRKAPPPPSATHK